MILKKAAKVHNAVKKVTGGDFSPFLQGAILIAGENLASAAVIGTLCPLITSMASGGSPGRIWAITGIMALAHVARTMLSMAGFRRMVTESYAMTSRARLTVGDHIRRLSLGFFTNRDLGTLSNSILHDTSLIDFLFSHFIPPLLGAIAFPVFLAAILTAIDWKLLLVAALPAVAAFPLLRLAWRTIGSLGSDALAAVDKMDSAVLEYVRGMRLMRSHGLTGSHNHKLLRLVSEQSRGAMNLEMKVTSIGFVFSGIMDCSMALVLLVAALEYSANMIDGATGAAFLVIVIRFFAPFMDAMQYSILSRQTLNALDRLDAIVSSPLPATPDFPLEPAGSDIEFRNVSFSYGGPDVLRRISFHAPERAMTALVGPSGAGKTTITGLMALFWDDYRGQILIGGVEIKDIDRERLMGMFAFIFQEVHLFSGSILDNIRIGDRKADINKVMEAARQAQCHEFVKSLPNGWDTMVGEGGCALSGGERQRVSIARALLKNAPIIICDEATASLDPINERPVREALGALVRNRTVIVIAHGLDSVKRAESIVVLNKGSVVDAGTHQELLSRPGFYRTMWEHYQRPPGDEPE